MLRLSFTHDVAAIVLSLVWFLAFAHSPWAGSPFLTNPFIANYYGLLFLMIVTGLLMARMLRGWFYGTRGRWQALRNAVAVPFGGGLVFCYLLVWCGARGDIASAIRHGNIFDLASGLLFLPLVGFGTVACNLIVLNGVLVVPLAILTPYVMGRLLKAPA